MRLRFGVLSMLLLATAFAWACSLNPQPLPPDTVDAAMGGADAKSASDAATLSPEGGYDLDAEPSPGDDAGDATDDASDAADSSDATESDAREDADDAGSDE